MNEIVNKFLLAGDKFMCEIHLNNQVLLIVLAVNLLNTKKEFKKKKKNMWTGNTKYIYKNDLDKASFQHDMAWGKHKDLTKWTQSGKGLRDKAFEIRSNRQYDGYQRGLSSMILKFFDKKYGAGSGVATLTNKSAIKSMSNQLQLADELHKPIIRKLNKRKVYSLFKDNIWGVDLADMQ